MPSIPQNMLSPFQGKAKVPAEFSSLFGFTAHPVHLSLAPRNGASLTSPSVGMPEACHPQPPPTLPPPACRGISQCASGALICRSQVCLGPAKPESRSVLGGGGGLGQHTMDSHRFQGTGAHCFSKGDLQVPWLRQGREQD